MMDNFLAMGMMMLLRRPFRTKVQDAMMRMTHLYFYSLN